MNREISRRELRLLMILPAVVIIAVYAFAYEWPRQKSVELLQKTNVIARRPIAHLDRSIADAKKRPVPPVSQAKRDVASITSEIEAEKRFAANQAHPSLILPSRWTNPSGRVNALRVAASTFEANGLIMVSRQSDAEEHGVVPREMQDFVKAVKNDGDHPVPEVWRIELIGSYPEFRSALDELGRSSAFIIPLAASMKAVPDRSGRQRWFLWLWV